MAELKFDQIEAEMLRAIQASARSTYGIQIEHLGIKQLQLPESITSTVFENMRAERQRLVAQYQAEGEREAKEIRSSADVQANLVLAEAKGQAIKISGGADTKAAKYYAQFNKNPTLANFLFQLRALEQATKEKTSVIVDQQTPPFNLFGGSQGSESVVSSKTNDRQ